MSRSKTWKNKKSELQQKEQMLLEDLNVNGSKVKRIARWSLGTGLAALVGYGIYRAFSTPSSEEIQTRKEKREREAKEKKRGNPKDLPYVDSAIENLAPMLGKWLLKQLKD